MEEVNRTKIICTIGPASESEPVIRKMAEEGMAVARLNLKHGTYEKHAEVIETIRRISKERPWPIAIMVDLQGPEIRTGKLKNKIVKLTRGDRIKLISEQIEGDEKNVSISYPYLPKLVKPGNRILIDDGLIELQVVKATDKEIECDVVLGGQLKENKGLSVRGVSPDFEIPTKKDLVDIEFAARHNVEFVALSFVRNAEDVERTRKAISEAGGNMQIIAKIEHADAYKNIDPIIEAADGVMVARGDLGVEMPLPGVPLIQKDVIHKCNRVGKAVITATQMLDSMISRPMPTRAEVSDIVNAILDGTDAMLLSGETAAGKYPVETVNMMRKVSLEAEKILNPRTRKHHLEGSVPDTVSFAACDMAKELGVRAIVCCTYSGRTARNVSKYRPKLPIYATTSSKDVMRKLALVWVFFRS